VVSLEDATVYRYDHKKGIRNLPATGYAPDGEHKPPHQGIDVETPKEFGGILTYVGSYPKDATCVNRIGMVPCIVSGHE
jgi:hypothetical protein